ncbi:MAG: flagellar biosynthesis protein FlhF, partial [Firmicutes bacterium]|nr:flagellar biosynthesis protein FlhF [Bacillota bacterium]
TMQEAIMMVKAELGREAIILHSKKIKKGGLFGLFGKPVFEVIAAVNSEERPPAATRPPRRELPAYREDTAAAAAAPVPRTSLPSTDNRELELLRRELAGMKEAINSLSSTLTKENRGGREGLNLPPGFEEVYSLFSQQEVADKYIREVLERLEAAEPKDNLVAEACRLASQSVEYLDLARTLVGQRIIALIGPTGVGKTTTIAKLAAQFALFDGRDVGLITADTYRIAAVDQLKTYAEIIGVPLEVVFSVEEIAEARVRLAHKDVILIDTAGRSQKNEEQLKELQEYLQAVKPTDVALVLSATTHPRGLLDCLERFKPCNYNQLIFTKIDEVETYGAMYNTLRDSGLPLTYLTTGQNVPDDISPGSPEYIAGLLLGSQGEE